MKFVIVKSRCACSMDEPDYFKGFVHIRIPARVGFGDTLADWIHRFLHITPCAACQRRRRILNLLFPYIRRDSLEYSAWNAYLASGLDRLPCIWDSETDTVSPSDASPLQPFPQTPIPSAPSVSILGHSVSERGRNTG